MEKNQPKTHLYSTLLFVFLFMVYIAICDSLKGVFIPVFKESFHVQNTSMGFLLTASSLGYILGTYVSGHLCELKGQKWILITGNIIIIATMPLMVISQSYFSVLVGLFIMNIGIAFVGIGINTLIPLIMVSFQSVLMNFIHFAYGFGSMMTQMNAGLLLFKGVSWKTMYGILGLVLLALTLLFLPIKFPPLKAKLKTDVPRDKKQILKSKLTWFYIVCLGFYAAGEMGTGSWLINYLQEGYGFDAKISAFYSGLFYGGLMLGRLLGGYVTEKLGYFKTVTLSLGGIVCLYPIGILLGAKGPMVIAICGLFCSIVFPTLVLTIGTYFHEMSAYATGIIITTVSTIVLFCNMLVGYLNDQWGVKMSIMMMPIFFGISFITSMVLKKEVRKIDGKQN